MSFSDALRNVFQSAGAPKPRPATDDNNGNQSHTRMKRSPTARQSKPFHDCSRPRPPSPRDRYRIAKLEVDFNQNLLDCVAEVAQKRGVSLYGQIRDFVEQGVRDFKADEVLDGGEKDDPTWSPNALQP